MKYNLNCYGALLIYNTSGRVISVISKYNKWSIADYDHNGKQIYYENSSGFINKYGR